MEVEEGVRDRLEVPGEAVGGAVARCGGEHGGVVGEEGEEGERLGAGGVVEVFAGRAREAEERCAAGQRVDAGVGVADQEERVALALDEEVGAEGARS